jgi:hypothetical protein
MQITMIIVLVSLFFAIPLGVVYLCHLISFMPENKKINNIHTLWLYFLTLVVMLMGINAGGSALEAQRNRSLDSIPAIINRNATSERRVDLLLTLEEQKVRRENNGRTN